MKKLQMFLSFNHKILDYIIQLFTLIFLSIIGIMLLLVYLWLKLFI